MEEKTVLLVLTRIHHVEVELIVSHVHRVGFEPTQLTLPGLKSGSLDHSDIDAKSQHPCVFFYSYEIHKTHLWFDRNHHSHLPHNQLVCHTTPMNSFKTLFRSSIYTHKQFQDLSRSLCKDAGSNRRPSAHKTDALTN